MDINELVDLDSAGKITLFLALEERRTYDRTTYRNN